MAMNIEATRGKYQSGSYNSQESLQAAIMNSWIKRPSDGIRMMSTEKKYCKAASNNAAQLCQAKNLQPQNEKAPHLVFIVVDNSWDTYNLTSQPLVGHHGPFGVYWRISKNWRFQTFCHSQFYGKKHHWDWELFLAAPLSISTNIFHMHMHFAPNIK